MDVPSSGLYRSYAPQEGRSDRRESGTGRTEGMPVTHGRSWATLNRRQRASVVGVLAIAVAVVAGWFVLGIHLRLAASDAGTRLTAVYFVGMIILANLVYFGHLKAIR